MILGAVDLRFRSRELQLLCNKRSALVERWGKLPAAVLEQTLSELEALECLADVAALPFLKVGRRPRNGEVVVAASRGVEVRLSLDLSDGAAWKECGSAVIVAVDVARKTSQRGGS